jgi:hypothetical protein
MVSNDAAWSSGATGIARDAEIAARLRQIANADAASTFIGFVLSSLHMPRCGCFALEQENLGDCWRGNALPVTAMPVATTPAPVTTVPVPVPVTAPANLLGLELASLFGAGDRGLHVRGRRRTLAIKRLRRQRRSLYAGGKGGGSGGKTQGEFQKVAAFHDVSLLIQSE